MISGAVRCRAPPRSRARVGVVAPPSRRSRRGRRRPRARARARRNTPAASAWRCRTRAPGAIATSGARPSHPRRPARARRRRESPASTSSRGCGRPFAKAERAHEMLVVRRPDGARGARGTAARSAAVRASRCDSPSARECRARHDVERRRETSSAAAAAMSSPADARGHLSRCTSSTSPAPCRNSERHGGLCRDRERRRPAKRAAQVGDRRQRHDRVAEPVRRDDDDAGHIGFFFRVLLATGNMPGTPSSDGPRVAPAPVHPQPELRMTPHVHLEHVRAALRELANRLVAVGARRLDRMLVDHPIAAARRAAARTPARPARRCAAPAPRAPTSSPRAARRSRRRSRRGSECADRSAARRRGRRAASASRGGSSPAGRSPCCRCAGGCLRAGCSAAALSSARASTPIGSICSPWAIACSSQ